MDQPAFAVAGEISVRKNISVNAKGFEDSLAGHAYPMVTIRHERPEDIVPIYSVNEPDRVMGYIF